MAYFDCIVGGSGKGNTLVVTCADELAGATITCTNGTKTYTKTCPSTSPYEVTFYGLMAGTWTVSATVGGNTYTTTVVVVDCAALLGGFNWRTWVDTAQFLDSTDYNSLSEVLADEEAIRELCLEHACVDYLADIATANEDVETIINNDLFAKWVNNSDYALDFLGANVAIKALMDTADKYFYGEWALMPQVPKMTSNTAPYGEVVFSGLNYVQLYPYMAFDGTDDENTRWASQGDNFGSPCYLGYHFTSPVKLSAVKIKFIAGITSSTCQVQGSNTGNTNDWHDIGEAITVGALDDSLKPIKSSQAYQYYRVYISNQTQTTTRSYSGQVQTLQFYAYAPKGNVPVMTANNAPYGVASASTEYSGQSAYKAFDGDNADGWVATSQSNQRLIYKFTNPICPKMAHLLPRATNDSTNCRVKNFKIQGSNDGSTWVDLFTGLHELNVTGDDCDLSENTNYYLYLACLVVDTYQNTGSYPAGINTLQFYGRELKVSVPTMTSNTTPYGEVVASSYNSGVEPYRAFDGSSSSNWGASTAGAWIEYDFGRKVNIRMISVLQHSQQRTRTFEILGADSKDGVFTQLKGDISIAGTMIHETIPSNEGYRIIRWHEQTRNGTYEGCLVSQIQFYGLDYSEKEFEEGTTKKWLYDHGLELEPITIGSQCVKENTQIVCNGLSNDATSKTIANTTNGVNLSPYNLMRGIFGNKCKASDGFGAVLVFTSTTIDWGTSWLANEQYPSIPNPNTTIHLGISSINESKIVGFGCGGNGGRQLSISELWLE